MDSRFRGNDVILERQAKNLRSAWFGNCGDSSLTWK